MILVVTTTAYLSFSGVSDLQEKLGRTVGTISIEENAYINSKNNKIKFYESRIILPNDELIANIQLENKKNYILTIRPSILVNVGGEPVKNITFNTFHISANSTSPQIYTFNIASEGENKVEFRIDIYNYSNKEFIRWASGTTSFEVTSQSDQLLSRSLQITGGALVASLTIGAITIVVLYKNAKASNKQAEEFSKQNDMTKAKLSFESLTKIFDMLSNKENRNKRKLVADEYWRLKDNNKPVIFSGEIKELAQELRESLNQVGVLYDKELIDPNVIFQIYDGVIIRSWEILKEDLQKDREKNQKIALYFEKLYIDADKYWKENHKEGDEYPSPYRN